MPDPTTPDRDVDAELEAKLEAWAVKLQASFNEDMTLVMERNHKLEDTVTQLSGHISNLELKVETITKSQEEETKQFEHDLNRLEQKLFSHVAHVEACLGFGRLESSKLYTTQDFRISSRLTNMEKVLEKFNQDLKVVERRVDVEQRYVQLGRQQMRHQSPPSERGMRSSLKSEPNLISHSKGEQHRVLPHSQSSSGPGAQPKSPQTPRSSRSRSRSPRSGKRRSRSPAKPSTRNPYCSGVYFPPRKQSVHVQPKQPHSHTPQHQHPTPPDTLITPSGGRPTSAPAGAQRILTPRSSSPSSSLKRHHNNQQQHQKNDASPTKSSHLVHTDIAEISRRIDVVDEKNDMQNMFLLRELMDNFTMHEKRSQQAVNDLDGGLKALTGDMQQRVDGVRSKVESMESDVRKSLQSKFRQIDQHLNGLQLQQQQVQQQQQQLQKQQALLREQCGELSRNRASIACRDHLNTPTEHPRRPSNQSCNVNSVTQGSTTLQQQESSEVTHTRELNRVLQDDITAERQNMKLLTEKFEAAQADLTEKFAIKEKELHDQIKEEQRKTAEMCSRLETDHKDVDELMREIENKYEMQMKKDEKKHAKKMAKLQSKFDDFIAIQIEVMGKLEQENMKAVAAAANSQQKSSSNELQPQQQEQQQEQQQQQQQQQQESNSHSTEEESANFNSMTEKNALLCVFDKTGGATDWSDSFLWSKDSDVSSWLGVDLDGSDRVTGLHLGCNGLTGNIPIELAQLQLLDDLRLFGNCLTGSIPSSLGNLTRLTTLVLNQNSLTGPIPSALSKCVLLEELDLSENHLTGLIPESVAAISGLTSLSLHENNFDGPLPRSLTTLRLLQHFSSDLLPFTASNDFCKVFDYVNAHASDELSDKSNDTDDYNSNLAEEQDTLLASLQALGGDAVSMNWDKTKKESHSSVEWTGVSFDLQGCVKSLLLADMGLSLIDGTFPESLEYLSNIVFLDLSHNDLSGGVPAEVLRLVHLQYLYLNNNSFDGAIPVEIKQLESLKTLNIAENELCGHLPLSLSSLEELAILNLSNNKLEGCIPEELGMFPKMRFFDLSSNALSGVVPDLGDMTLLETFNVSSNQLHGPLPPSVGGLVELRHLDVSFNKHMNGALPSSITQLANLLELNMQMTDIGEEVTAGDGSVAVQKKAILKKLPSLYKISM